MQAAAESLDSTRPIVVRLLLASFLMLFLELALIRWLGANVVHLSYFSNFVLLGSFLGIGAGFLISRKAWSIWPWSLPLLTALVLGVLAFPVTIERAGSDVIYFTALAVRGPPAWLALPVVFVLVAVILAGPNHTIIEDLNSTNGIAVNGKRITRHTLRDGDNVAIGKTTFRFAVRPMKEARTQ